MLDGLRQFITEMVSPNAEQRVFDETDYRLSATALLIHIVSLDGRPTAIEKRNITAWAAANDIVTTHEADPSA